MRGAMLLAILFVALSVVESSMIWVFHAPWISAVPMMTIAGFLIVQRIGIVEGVMWFIALMLLRMDITMLIMILIAPTLTIRLFSTRSVYALLGVGITTYGMMIFVVFLFHSIGSALALSMVWHAPFSLLLMQWVLLVPGLYLGLSTVRWFERTVGSHVTFKPLT